MNQKLSELSRLSPVANNALIPSLFEGKPYSLSVSDIIQSVGNDPTVVTNVSNSLSEILSTIFPYDFQQDGKFWTSTISGPVGPLDPDWGFISVPGIGRVAHRSVTGTEVALLGTLGRLTLVPEQKYKISSRFRFTEILGAGVSFCTLHAIILDQNKLFLDEIVVASAQVSVGDGWTDVTLQVDSNDLLAFTNASYMMPLIRFQGNVIPGELGNTHQIQYLKLEDITDVSVNAQNILDAQNDLLLAAAEAAAAMAAINDISNDNVLSIGEKSIVILNYNTLISQRTGIQDQAIAYEIYTEKDDYINAIDNLVVYLSTLNFPVLWNDVSGVTYINGFDFRSKFQSVYDKRQLLLNKIYEKAREAAEAAETLALDAQAQLADIASDNKLTPVEKRIVVQNVSVILSEKTDILNTATRKKIYTEASDYSEAVDDLEVYLATLTTPTLWDDLGGVTDIVGTDFRFYFEDLYTKKQILLNLIAGKKPKTFYQSIIPTGTESIEEDRWVDTSKKAVEYSRGSDAFLIGGVEYTFGGEVITVPWVQVGDHSADKTAENITRIEYPAIRNIKCDSLGNPLEGQFPDIGGIRVTKGGESIKLDDDVTYTIKSSKNLVNAVINNNLGSSSKGDWTVDGMTASPGTLEIDVNFGTFFIGTASVSFVKDKAAASFTGSSGSKQAIIYPESTANSTSFSVISPVAKLTLASGESLYTIANLDYGIGGNVGVERNSNIKAQYSPDSTSWSDFGAANTSSTSAISSLKYFNGADNSYDWEPGRQGVIDLNQSKSGLATGDWYIRVVASLSANGYPASFSGSILIEAKT